MIQDLLTSLSYIVNACIVAFIVKHTDHEMHDKSLSLQG